MVEFIFAFILLFVCIIKIAYICILNITVALLIHGVVYQLTGISIYRIFYNKYIKNLLIY